MDSLVPRWAVEAHLGGLFEGTPAEDDQNPSRETSTPCPAPGTPTCAREERGQERLDLAGRGSGPLLQRDSLARKDLRHPGQQDTDPDATPMTCGTGSGRKLGYRAHYVVDGGKARIVLNALVAPAEVTENRPMLDLLWRTCFRWRLRPHHITADD